MTASMSRAQDTLAWKLAGKRIPYGNRNCLQPVRTKNYRKPYFENGTAIEHNRNDAETVPDIRQKNGDNKEECMEYHIILTI